MPTRDLRPGCFEEWSSRNQTLRHAGELRRRDDAALLHNPTDYSALGGPDDERIYGHTRSDSGYYPWNAWGGAYDCDSLPSIGRGGYVKRAAPCAHAAPIEHKAKTPRRAGSRAGY